MCELVHMDMQVYMCVCVFQSVCTANINNRLNIIMFDFIKISLEI